MKKNMLAPFRPLLILFIVFNAFFIAGKSMMTRWNIDRDLLIGGHLVIFLVVLISYIFLYKGVHSSNPNAFVRAMYGSFVIKFFLIALAAFIYIMVEKKNVNKPALIVCMFLYLLYTFMEVSVLLRLLKQKKNA